MQVKAQGVQWNPALAWAVSGEVTGKEVGLDRVGSDFWERRGVRLGPAENGFVHQTSDGTSNGTSMQVGGASQVSPQGDRK